MRTGMLLGLIALIAIAAVCVTVTNRTDAQNIAQPSAAETFTIDGVHSSCVFKIKHMGVANFYGRFNDISGTYSLNEANSSFNLQLKTESVDTGNRKRDDHLRSPDFFNATEFPAITFTSTSAQAAGPNKLRVTGNLSLHGVTKPITADVEFTPGKQTPQGLKSGFEAKFTIKRSEFNMSTFIAEGGLGDEVEVIFSGEGKK